MLLRATVVSLFSLGQFVLSVPVVFFPHTALAAKHDFSLLSRSKLGCGAASQRWVDRLQTYVAVYVPLALRRGKAGCSSAEEVAQLPLEELAVA